MMCKVSKYTIVPIFLCLLIQENLENWKNEFKNASEFRVECELKILRGPARLLNRDKIIERILGHIRTTNNLQSFSVRK